MYHLYILECADGSLYTGITVDLDQRLKKHQEGSGARYTKAKKAVRYVYTERHSSRSAALKREAEIKGWPRQKKLQLVKSIS